MQAFPLLNRICGIVDFFLCMLVNTILMKFFLPIVLGDGFLLFGFRRSLYENTIFLVDHKTNSFQKRFSEKVVQSNQNFRSKKFSSLTLRIVLNKSDWLLTKWHHGQTDSRVTCIAISEGETRYFSENDNKPPNNRIMCDWAGLGQRYQETARRKPHLSYSCHSFVIQYSTYLTQRKRKTEVYVGWKTIWIKTVYQTVRFIF